MSVDRGEFLKQVRSLVMTCNGADVRLIIKPKVVSKFTLFSRVNLRDSQCS